MENKRAYNSENEIDLLELVKTIWRAKKTIIRFVSVFGIIGLFIAVFSEKEYTASTIVISQTTESRVGGSLGGLAAIAGINLGSRGSKKGISPSLYPRIVQSIPFKKELLNVFLKFPHVKGKITYKEYYEKYKRSNVLSVMKDYTIGLPSKVLSLFNEKTANIPEVVKDSIYRISKEDNALFKKLEEQLVLDINSKDGFIKISFSMSEALPSAQMTKKVQELLQKAIISFKTQKSKDEFNFLEERYNDLKKDFEKKQMILANYRDRNQNLITSRSQSRLESLQSEYNLAFSIYSEIAKQLETQKIKLKENTPIFTVIEPLSVPVAKSKPKRVIILFVWLFLGIVSGVGFVFGKKWLISLNIINK